MNLLERLWNLVFETVGNITENNCRYLPTPKHQTAAEGLGCTGKLEDLHDRTVLFLTETGVGAYHRTTTTSTTNTFRTTTKT